MPNTLTCELNEEDTEKTQLSVEKNAMSSLVYLASDGWRNFPLFARLLIFLYSFPVMVPSTPNTSCVCGVRVCAFLQWPPAFVFTVS